MKYLFLLVLTYVYVQHIIHQSEAKVFTKCGLTQELLRRNVSRSWVGNWVCLVESESYKDTSKVTTKASGGKALGIFQINSKEWCQYNKPGGLCNMKCEDLINDDISDDVYCFRKAIDQLGFQGWDGWKRSCKGREFVTKMPNCPGL